MSPPKIGASCLKGAQLGNPRKNKKFFSAVEIASQFVQEKSFLAFNLLRKNTRVSRAGPPWHAICRGGPPQTACPAQGLPWIASYRNENCLPKQLRLEGDSQIKGRGRAKPTPPRRFATFSLP